MRGFLSLAILAATLLPAQDAQQGGPTQLIITYRCPPPRRAAFRQYMTEFGVQRFDRWKLEGILKDYRFLFNWYIDVDTWDAMAVLSFPDYAAVVRWKDIEKGSPGGLPRDALEMAWPLNSNSADLVTREAANAPADLAHTLFFVVAYDFPAAAAYRDYANASIIPQAKALVRDGVLSAYSVFANRYPGGKRWQGLVVFEYKDVDAFSKRDEAIAKVRAQLKATENRQAEREPVIAESIGPTR